MKILKINSLKNHDVYEFCTAKNFSKHWNKNSLYVEEEDFLLLMPYLNEFFKNYNYYGPEKISIKVWNQIKKKAIEDNKKIKIFFEDVDVWLKNNNEENLYFYILGI